MGSKRAPNRRATRKPETDHAAEVRRLRSDPWCAAALSSGTPIEEVRAAFLARRSPLDRLGDVGRELHDLDVRRRELLAERSRLVDALRREGRPWNALAAAAGVSRPTLIQAGAS